MGCISMNLELSCPPWCRWQFNPLSSTYSVIKNLDVETNSIMKILFVVIKFHCKWETRRQRHYNLALPNQTCNCLADNTKHTTYPKSWRFWKDFFFHFIKIWEDPTIAKLKFPSWGILTRLNFFKGWHGGWGTLIIIE